MVFAFVFHWLESSTRNPPSGKCTVRKINLNSGFYGSLSTIRTWIGFFGAWWN